MRVTVNPGDSHPATFFIAPYKVNGSSFAEPGGDARYTLPRGMHANRLSLWMKWPDGYREANAALSTTAQTVQYGTYAVDPNSPKADESNGWHYYHQLKVRHDVEGVNGEWVNLVINQMPHHLRGVNSGKPVDNEQSQWGQYMELMTRFYIDCVPYALDPEIAEPYDVLVDDITMYYEEEVKPVVIQIENFRAGQEVIIQEGVATDFAFTLTNTTGATVTGKLGKRAHGSSGVQLLDAGTLADVNLTTISLTADETKNYIMRVTPATSYAEGSIPRIGILWVPESFVTVNQASIADPNVETTFNYYGFVGCSDATLCSSHLRCYITASTPSGTMTPWVQGGVQWEAAEDTPLVGQLDAHDPDDDPLTYSLTYNSPSGGSISIHPTTGVFTYTPSSGFTGTFQFRFKANDGTQDSITATHWIIVE